MVGYRKNPLKMDDLGVALIFRKPPHDGFALGIPPMQV